MRPAFTFPALLSLLVALGGPGFASAQEPVTQEPQVTVAEPEVDPPGRVARLSFISGDVSFQSAEDGNPEDAVLNHPVTSGDRLMTGPRSRAELTMGVAAIRANENTDLSVAVLDDDLAQFVVNSGTVSIRVREIPSGTTFEVDTPHSAIRLLERGEYRVDVASDGAATLAVREGDAEIDSGSGPVRVGARQVARLAPGARFADVRGIDRMDEFDEWSARRERELTGREEATRYVSREVVGYEDLDRYGTWAHEPGYGTVWYPSHVVVGWAPYRFGTWKWIGPWGWTWIDYAPWGFAPFHYGRWAFVNHRWCWVPGPRLLRPVYAPGLVVWTSWHHHSGGFHFSRHHRPKGWYPLGPHDIYIPHRRVTPRYLHRVNASNTLIRNNTLLTNAYHNRLRDFRFANRDIPGAHTLAPDHEPPRHSRWRSDNGRAAGFVGNRSTDGRMMLPRNPDRGPGIARHRDGGRLADGRPADQATRSDNDRLIGRGRDHTSDGRLTDWRRDGERRSSWATQGSTGRSEGRRDNDWRGNGNNGRLADWRRDDDRRSWNNGNSHDSRLTDRRRSDDRGHSNNGNNGYRARSGNPEPRMSSGQSNNGRLTEWRPREQRSSSASSGSLMRGNSGNSSRSSSSSGGAHRQSSGATRSFDRGSRGQHPRR
jgi:hypothetical protein